MVMTIKKVYLLVMKNRMMATLFLLPLCLSSCGENQPPLIEYPFHDGGGYPYRAFYSDAFFSGDSTMVDARLASLTSSASLISRRFISKEEPRETKYASDFMEACGMEDVYFSPSYYQEPTETSIAYGIASKKISDKTLVWTFVVGEGYGLEWLSNFDIGAEGDCHGFAACAAEVVNGLKNYIVTKPIEGNVCLLLTGYSRGAAVANLAGASLDDLMNEGEAAIGKATISFKDTYVYGCETPATTSRLDYAAPKYRNIHNFLNQNDPIPMVPPRIWGLNVIGQRHYYPDRLTDIRYPTQREALLATLESIFGKKQGYPDEDWTTVADPKAERYPSMHRALVQLFNGTGGALVGTRAEFAADYQEAFGRLIHFMMEDSRSGALIDAITGRLFAIMLKQGELMQALDLIKEGKYTDGKEKLLKVCRGIFEKTPNIITILEYAVGIVEPLFPLIKRANDLGIEFNVMAYTGAFSAVIDFHYRFVTAAWAATCDGQHGGPGNPSWITDGTYYRLSVSPVQDFTLTLDDGTSVLTVVEGKIDSSIVSASIADGTLTAFLPKNGKYGYSSSASSDVELFDVDWFGNETAVRSDMPVSGTI